MKPKKQKPNEPTMESLVRQIEIRDQAIALLKEDAENLKAHKMAHLQLRAQLEEKEDELRGFQKQISELKQTIENNNLDIVNAKLERQNLLFEYEELRKKHEKLVVMAEGGGGQILTQAQSTQQFQKTHDEVKHLQKLVEDLYEKLRRAKNDHSREFEEAKKRIEAHYKEKFDELSRLLETELKDSN
jgi:hypothetical protein